MKKEDLIEYYTNGCMKHRIVYYPDGKTKYIITYHPNGNKYFEQFYDLQGKHHRKQGLPDYQQWHENGILYHKIYYVHGYKHNMHNPCVINFFTNARIFYKVYYLNNYNYSKLTWMNLIKKI